METSDASILDSVKKALGYESDYTPFDPDLIMFINSSLRVLNQLGIGVQDFAISDNTSKWIDFLGDDVNRYSEVFPVVYQRVRLMHDPPSNSYLTDAINKNIAELEWRLNSDAECHVPEDQEEVTNIGST